jgi:hypothetical protein
MYLPTAIVLNLSSSQLYRGKSTEQKRRLEWLLEHFTTTWYVRCVITILHTCVLLVTLSVYGLHSLLWNVKQSVVIICFTDENCRFKIRALRAVQMEIRGVWVIRSHRVGTCCFCGSKLHWSLEIICDLTRCHIPEVQTSTVVAFCVFQRRSLQVNLR